MYHLSPQEANTCCLWTSGIWFGREHTSQLVGEETRASILPNITLNLWCQHLSGMTEWLCIITLRHIENQSQRSCSLSTVMVNKSITMKERRFMLPPSFLSVLCQNLTELFPFAACCLENRNILNILQGIFCQTNTHIQTLFPHLFLALMSVSGILGLLRLFATPSFILKWMMSCQLFLLVQSNSETLEISLQVQYSASKMFYCFSCLHKTYSKQLWMLSNAENS